MEQIVGVDVGGSTRRISAVAADVSVTVGDAVGGEVGVRVGVFVGAKSATEIADCA